MSDPLEYAAVPKPLIEGMERLGSPPPSGGGRVRLDLSVNAWTLIGLILLVVAGFLTMDRLHAQVEVLNKQVEQLVGQQNATNRRLLRVETHDIMLRQDLRGFPLHRHSTGARVDIYPPKYDSTPEDLEK